MLTVEEVIPLHVRRILGLLAEREYKALANLTGNNRLSEEEMRVAIEGYGRTLIEPPSGIPSDLRIKLLEGPPRSIFLTMSLWTEEEGQSDLSLEMAIVDVRGLAWLDEIHNIRVM